MDIKAIETEYNGYRFRSRLEARWAVFFDALGIKYEYEPEGFELSDGTKYLPDFYLPDFDYYVEVKGLNNHLTDDLNRVKIFVTDSKKSVIILSSIPYSKKSKGLYLFPVINYISRWGTSTINSRAFFIKLGEGWEEEHPCYLVDDFYICSSNKWICVESWGNEKNHEILNDVLGEKYDTEDCPVREFYANELEPIQKAIKKARQARFEHGEKP